MIKRARFIVNPRSGSSRKKGTEKLLAKGLDPAIFEHDIAYTEAPGHATSLASEAARDGYEVVVAVGGDGSVNEVGRALVGTRTALGILPMGSGNGVARHLRIPTKSRKALEVLHRHKTQLVDTMLVNDNVCIGMAGVGFDARVGWEFARFGKRGLISYVRVALREFRRYQPKTYDISIDGTQGPREAFLVSVANGSQYGNNATIAPHAKMDDGLLDVCILRPFPALSIPVVAWKLFRRGMDELEYLEAGIGKKIVIRQPETLAHIDGEPIELGQTIVIECRRASLWVVVP